LELAGRVAIVTGAGAGIGEGIAVRLAAEGCAVVAADIDADAANAVVRTIADAGGRATAVRADVAVEPDVVALMREADTAFGGLDILVNNAGGAEDVPFPVAPPEQWGRTIDVNLRGVMLGIQAALPPMRRRGGGAVVSIASLAGVGLGPHDAPEYAAAKAGVIRLTAALTTLASSDGVRVNCVAPDWVDTPASRRTRAVMTPEELTTVPPVLLRPDEIADAVVTLLADDTLAGRVIECWCGRPPRLVPVENR